VKYRLTEAADEDVGDILRETARLFGRLQRRNYAALIEKAIEMVAEHPERGGSRQRDELALGLRSFHVELAAGRRGAASHVLYYFRGRLPEFCHNLESILEAFSFPDRSRRFYPISGWLFDSSLFGSAKGRSSSRRLRSGSGRARNG
jgi:toxin ParE1/3/4